MATTAKDQKRKQRDGAPSNEPLAPREPPRLKLRYRDELQARIKDQLGLANVMEVPRLEKIVVNMGVGKATQQASLLEGAVNDLTLITGQKPLVTRARRSIAAFKLREGNAIGAKVTLRGDRMWSSSTASSASRSPASGTSGGSRPTPSTAAATTRSA
jgi:hypothetical protein